MPAESFEPYTSEWYASHASAQHLAQTMLVARAIGKVERPRRVIDVGCGIGTFLKGVADEGAEICMGIEAPHARNMEGWFNSLVVPREWVFFHDLQRLKQFSSLGGVGSFDLAICVEVAEHLPYDVGPELVKFLTRLAPRVAWSAAYVGQGGEGHINEQEASYWLGLFAKEGFELDLEATEKVRSEFRGKINEVWWYSNLMLLKKVA